MSKDPVVKALKDIKRDADRQAQSNNKAVSESGSARWHTADAALKAYRRK
jgi:hypothetical protein